ncbi:TRAFAC clade GTPase domain-containing protein [Cryobacterium sinapicolor]|nr:hypothetical protein [Cryobacterium sinapicolor]
MRADGEHDELDDARTEDPGGDAEELGSEDDSDDEDTEFDLGESDSPPEALSNSRVTVSSGDGLTLSEANRLVGDVPSTVVLIAGEANAGKTTLLVELFAQFLSGPTGPWEYAGSQTVSGFHRRHKPARASSGATSPATARTQDDEIHHLHLAVAAGSRRVDLVVSDIRGEVFESIIDGATALQELPFLPRVDICLVLVDGEQMGHASTRSLQLLRAQQLLMGLLEHGGLRDETRVLLIATKADKLTPQVRDASTAALEAIAGGLRRRPAPVAARALSARPADNTAPMGLAEVLEYLVEKPVSTSQPVAPTTQPGGRHFWNGTQT